MIPRNYPGFCLPSFPFRCLSRLTRSLDAREVRRCPALALHAVQVGRQFRSQRIRSAVEYARVLIEYQRQCVQFGTYPVDGTARVHVVDGLTTLADVLLGVQVAVVYPTTSGSVRTLELVVADAVYALVALELDALAANVRLVGVLARGRWFGIAQLLGIRTESFGGTAVRFAAVEQDAARFGRQQMFRTLGMHALDLRNQFRVALPAVALATRVRLIDPRTDLKTSGSVTTNAGVLVYATVRTLESVRAARIFIVLGRAALVCVMRPQLPRTFHAGILTFLALWFLLNCDRR